MMNLDPFWKDNAERLDTLVTKKQLDLPPDELQEILADVENGEYFSFMDSEVFSMVQGLLVMKHR